MIQWFSFRYTDFRRLRGKWSNDQGILVDDRSGIKILEDREDSSRLRGMWSNDPVILRLGINQTEKILVSRKDSRFKYKDSSR